MGDPLTGAAAASMGVNLLGTALRGQSEVNALGAKAKADQQNQQLAEAQAADALQRGGWQAGVVRGRTSQMIGQQRVGYAASGVDENGGTPGQVQLATRRMGEADAQTTINNARRQAWGYNMMANQYGAEASMDRQAQGEARFGNILGGLGQGLGGFGKLYRGTNGFSAPYSEEG